MNVLILGIILALMVNLVSAVGISSEYHNKNILKIGPGETKDIIFGSFQNTDTKDHTIKIELIEGKGIATIIDSGLDSFKVPAGKLDLPLNIKVSIPSEIAEGTSYTITVSYLDITPGNYSGMVTMDESRTSSIPILVEKAAQPEEKPSENSLTWVILVVALVIIIAIVAYLLLKGKASKK